VVGGSNFSSAVGCNDCNVVTGVLLIFYLVYFFGFRNSVWFLEDI